MEIEFLNQKIKLSLPKKYSEFIELCKQTFYISEERSKNLSFSYIENGEETAMEEDDYANRDSLKANIGYYQQMRMKKVMVKIRI